MRHGEKSAAACSVDGQAETSPLLPILEGRADHKQGCCSASDAEDARRVAQRLGIPFYALNLEREFSDIIEYFVDEYALGRTPNPCVVCNNHLKFGTLGTAAARGNAGPSSRRGCFERSKLRAFRRRALTFGSDVVAHWGVQED